MKYYDYYKQKRDIERALEILTDINKGQAKYFVSLGNPGTYEKMAIRASEATYELGRLTAWNRAKAEQRSKAAKAAWARRKKRA